MIAWVLGSSGLLGGALCRTLRERGIQIFIPAQRFTWNNRIDLRDQMTAAVRDFAAEVRTTACWQIYWAAGIGTMASPADLLTPETEILNLLLDLIQSDTRLLVTPGTFSFASSAGAIYAGSTDDIITEATAPAPTTPYALEKMKQEALIRGFVIGNSRMTGLIARISTLYGSGQTIGKRQGLLGYIARSILNNEPVHIYVPYDTIRDYIHADDAAIAMVAAAAAAEEPSRAVTKIIASEAVVTIAEIVSVFRRLARRSPRIIRSANRLSSLYTPRIQFKSIVLPECKNSGSRTLAIGISQLMMTERASFVQGKKAATK